MILNRLVIRKHKSSLLLTQNYLFGVKKFISSIELLENMPANARPPYKKNKMKMKNDPVLHRPYRIYWQVIGAGNFGAPTALALITENHLYFFNCGDATQRTAGFIVQNASLSKTRDVFITQSNWKNLGGLPGLCLGLRGFGVPELNVHGPPGCMDIYNATKDFINLREFKVKENKDKEYVDNGVEITKVTLTCDEKIMPTEIHSSWVINNKQPPQVMKNDHFLNWKQTKDGNVQEDTMSEDIKPYENSIQAYVCKFLPRVGKLNAELCVDFGVPPGPLFGQLKAGKDITLPDGRIVRSIDVMGETSAVSSDIVLEVPELKYMTSLVNNTSEFKNAENLRHIFHLSPPEVVADPRYQKWMKEIGTDVQHILMNRNCTGLGLMGVRSYQAKLRLMNKNIFPELAGTVHEPNVGYDVMQDLVSVNDGLKTVMGKSGLRLNIRPSTELPIEMDEDCIFDKEAAINEGLCSSEDVVGDVEGYKIKINEALQYSNSRNSEVSSSEKQYPEVTMLGTASAMSGKYRNNTGILVEVKQDHFIFLDCGEGSLNQLVRLRGEEDARRVLKNLKAIYISHQHADHHLGSIELLTTREDIFKESNETIPPLYLAVTRKYSNFLTSYHKNIQPVLTNLQLLKNEELIFHTQKNEYYEEILDADRVRFIDKNVLDEFQKYVGLSHIETCRALHCRDAFCLTLTTENGFKLTFSGDTRPIARLVEIGKDSDLLIHEGSIEHCMIKDAIIKKHSTFTEAINVGKDMKAKFTLITHFSQRYSKMPLLEEIENEENVGIAFDNLVVNPSNVQQIRLLYPALKLMFSKEYDDMLDRSESLKITLDRDPDMNPDDDERPDDYKTELIRKLDQRYKEKQEIFKEIQQWRKDMVDKNKPPSPEKFEQLSNLINKVSPDSGSRSASPSRKSPAARSTSNSPPSGGADKKNIKRSRSPPLVSNIHDKLLKIKSKDSPERVKNTTKKRNVSPPSPVRSSSTADIPDRLLKVAKKDAGSQE